MEKEYIDDLFMAVIFSKGIHKPLEIDKNQISNYRRREKELSFGLKLEILSKLNLIKIDVQDNPEIKNIFDFNQFNFLYQIDKACK